jgi:hypothetical protein
MSLGDFSVFIVSLLATLSACSSKESSSNGGPSDGATETGDETADAGAEADSSATDAAPEAFEAGNACVGPQIPKMPECESCQNEKCCVTGGACVKDPECVALQDCANSGTPCPSAHKAGQWNWSGVEICRENSCATECGLPESKCGNIVPDPASCLGEVQEKCCPETAACGANESCVALIYQCFDQNGCTDATCLSDCRAKYPDGLDDFDAMVACWGKLTCL